MNQKQRYMVVMAQNLYFHAMADNRGVMLKLAARAAEEDIKEEMLLYAVLTKENARRQDIPDIDAAIEQYLAASFGVSVDFDITDALDRLIADGLVDRAAGRRAEGDAAERRARCISTASGMPSSTSYPIRSAPRAWSSPATSRPCQRRRLEALLRRTAKAQQKTWPAPSYRRAQAIWAPRRRSKHCCRPTSRRSMR